MDSYHVVHFENLWFPRLETLYYIIKNLRNLWRLPAILHHFQSTDSVSMDSAINVILRITTILLFVPWNRTHYLPLHVLGSIFVFFIALLSLSYAATENWIPKHDKSDKQLNAPRISQTTLYRTRVIGLLAGLYILSVAIFLPSNDPLDHVRIRVLAFFNAAKILDLTVARASSPPMRVEDNKPILVQGSQRRLEYIWLLAAETRYHSFDISIYEPGREKPAKKIWTIGPTLTLPILLWLFPKRVELYVLLSLLIIQIGGETMHSVLDPSCTYPLFYQPLAANSVASFWRSHWHSAAASFLYTLGYRPARNSVSKVFGGSAGKAAGVLGAFCVSGMWHGWAAAALVTTPWRTAGGIWALFMTQGVACIVEGALPKEKRRGGVVLRVIIWWISLWGVAVWIKDSLPRSNVPLVVEIGKKID